jgi:hypothetical protein
LGRSLESGKGERDESQQSDGAGASGRLYSVVGLLVDVAAVLPPRLRLPRAPSLGLGTLRGDAMNKKLALLLLALTAMTSGCWWWGPRDGGYHDHDHYDHHEEHRDWH